MRTQFVVATTRVKVCKSIQVTLESIVVLLVVSTVFGLNFQADSKDFITYRVPCNLYPLQQPSENTCWAATTSMLLDWKKQRGDSIDSALEPYEGGIWKVKFNAGDGITEFQEAKLLEAVGLKAEAPQNPTITGWLKLLKSYGPLIVTTKAQGNWVHATLLIEIFGDGTAAGTSVTVIDPGDAKEKAYKFSDFLKKYEDASNYGIQIVHLPDTTPPCN